MKKLGKNITEEDKENPKEFELPEKVITSAMESAVDIGRNRNVALPMLDPEATSFVIPTVNITQGRTILPTKVKLAYTSCNIKRLIFRLFNVTHHELFVKNNVRKATHPATFRREVPPFVEWLNETDLTNSEFDILRIYQNHLINKGLKGEGQVSSMKAIFNSILPKSIFGSLTRWEQTIIIKWGKYRPIREERNEQNTITSYFQSCKWLTGDELGIGERLFSQLVSPKQNIQSMQLTLGYLSNAIYDTQKDAIKLFKLAGITKNEIPYKGKYKTNPRGLIAFELANLVKKLIKTYKNLTDEEQACYQKSLLIIIYSYTHESTYELLRDFITSSLKYDIEALFTCRGWNMPTKTYTHFLLKEGFTVFYSEHLFGWIKGETLSNPIDDFVFVYLMASMAVQPSDIAKLKKENFKQVKPNRSSRVISIECEYFKGRAGMNHLTEFIDTRLPHGKFLLRFINQVSDRQVKLVKTNYNKPIAPLVQGGKGSSCLTKTLRALLNLNPPLKAGIIEAHKRKGVSSAFFQALAITLLRGESWNSYHRQAIHELGFTPPLSGIEAEEAYHYACQLWNTLSNTKVQSSFLPLSYVKNSAVHAGSDPIDVNKLFIPRSHSPETEETHYLNESNEKWLNSTGRITRNVMNDLLYNVFNPSGKIKVFSEYSNQDILHKHNDKVLNNANHVLNSALESGNNHFMLMKARLEFVTEQKGRINEVGIMKGASSNNDGLPNILVCDNAETAFRVMAYQSEISENYKVLIEENPDHFFFSVLPNLQLCEYIECRLSKESITSGTKFLERYKPHVIKIRRGCEK